jgi:signal transduction histidine kinase
VVTDAFRSLLAEPRAANPPARVWRDWVLVAVLVPTILLEAILREDVTWRPVVTVVALALVPVLLWRRTHPLLMTAIAFGAATVLQVPYFLGQTGEIGLNSTVFFLLLPYALCRWASGRDIVIGTAIIFVPAFLSLVVASGTLEEMLGGSAVLIASFALGAAMRFRANARSREMDQARSVERAELARELHDTVAHHVSAIAIQAQAGRAVAASRPAAAVEALSVIEAEASRTLDEMRTMVRVLREGTAAPDFAPQRGIADLELLARMASGGPVVEVEREGVLDSLPRAVDVAVYRIAQESVTNAIRHARHASRVDVRVLGADGAVHLTVHDDGDGRAAAGAGYGLLGMAERAKLLGGSCAAGPDERGGWTVAAVLPREVAP